MADMTQDFMRDLLGQIDAFERDTQAVEVGIVEEVGDGIALASGLTNVRAQELVEFASGTLGVAFNLEEESVGIIILGDYLSINEGDEVRATGRINSIPVGRGLVGRVIDGTFIVDTEGVIQYAYYSKTPGDHPTFDVVLATAQEIFG